MNNIRSYKKLIREAKKGDKFFFNAISGTSTMVDYTRDLIKSGKIAPDGEELVKMINSDSLYKFFNGDSIAPQMTYVVLD